MDEISKLTLQYDNDEKISIPFNYPSDEIFITINSIIARILNRNNKLFLLDTIVTILREIILNAAKANFKRIFFKNSDLNINDNNDYSKGMLRFKNIINNLDSIESDLQNNNYNIKIEVSQMDKGIKIEIINNVEILPIEFERVNSRIEEARRCLNFSDAYNSAFDSTEGAGLGIILNILLLKNAGINPDFYKVKKNKKYVTTSILIPNKLRQEKTITTIIAKIIDALKALPTFPKHLTEIQNLCHDHEVNIVEIASKISHDPSLATEVLKLSNSAGFITGKKIDNIIEAILIIGLQNLNLILSATAARKIIEKRYKKFEDIWNHCNKTAFYARHLAIILGFTKISEHAFISGLLHDIGKIVLLSVDTDLVKQITEMVHNRKIINSAILEEVTIGISHAEVGSQVVKKWNFPDYIVEAIGKHHSPLNSKNKFINIIVIVYLANMMCEIETNNATFSFLEVEILTKYHIKNYEDFNKLHEQIKLEYQNHNSSIGVK